MKNRLILLLLIAIASVLIIFFLYLFSKKENLYRGGFVRNYYTVLSRNKEVDLDYNTYYFAGVSHSAMYLGNHTAPLHLLRIDSLSVSSVQINSPIAIESSQVLVDSSDFYIADLIRHHIYRGRVSDFSLLGMQYNDASFTDFVPISPSSFVVRDIDLTIHENVLEKKSKLSYLEKRSTRVLEKQLDGIFCTDGMLHYSPQLKNIVYVYYYRNQFLKIDSDLNVLKRYTTLDTISKAKITVKNIRADQYTQLSSPPLLVNRRSVVDRSVLYVNSNIEADNDTPDTFQDFSVIDVYALEDGSYHYSFRVPNYQGFKMKQFTVNENRLYAIHDRHLVIYSLQPD